MNPTLAELVGTAILILIGCGVNANVILTKTFGHAGGWIVITSGWGMAVFAAVAAVEQFSGAHINPAVSIGLATAGVFEWSLVPTYIAAQLAGAFVGAVLVYLAYYKHFQANEQAGDPLGTFSTIPAIRAYPWNLATEVIATFTLVFVVLHFAHPSLSMDGTPTPIGLGSVGAIRVGLLIFAIGLGLGGATGYAINPARDLGPRIAHALLPIPQKGPSDWAYAWVPIVGPVAGGVLAALAFTAMRH